MINYIKSHGVLTGSKVFGGYIAGKSDIDYMILENHIVNIDTLLDNSFEYESECYDESDFESYKKDGINVLLFSDKDRYYTRVAATQLMIRLLNVEAKFLKKNVDVHKEARISMFRAITNLIDEFSLIKKNFQVY